MKKATLHALLVTVLLIPLLIGGCVYSSTKPAPQTMEEAKVYLLDYLERKYDEEFIITSGEHEDVLKSTGWTYYFVYFTPEGDPGKVFFARAVSSGLVPCIDDYGKYLFKEEAEALCGSICEEKDYIESYTVELKGIPTNSRWTEKNTFEEYLGEGTNMDSLNYVTVYLKDGLTDEEYAAQISDLMGDMVVAPCGINIEVQANGEMIYWMNIYRDYKPGHDVDGVFSDIAGQRISNELNAEHAARTQGAG